LGGIVALLGFGSGDSTTLVRKICQAMEHRGPDDSGWFVGTDVALGNVISYNDSAKVAHQPLCNRDGSVWITFDGELYNGDELKGQVGDYEFVTTSDAEIVLKAYEKYGQNCLKQLDGIFAYCIWDSLRMQLLCARDRFGARSLYYYRGRSKYIFASEIRAIFVDSEVPRIPNHNLIREYLLTGDASALYRNGDTFFAQVKELLPGYYITLDEKSMFQAQEYWHPRSVSFQGKRNGAYPSKFLSEFRYAIKKMLPRQAPFAICLSGGLDSTSIAAIIDELVRTYDAGKHKFVSAIYEGASKVDNEEPYIREFGSFRRVEIEFVRLPRSLEWADVKDLVYHLEEPRPVPNSYLLLCIAKQLKKEGIKVVFTGQGGDGFLWGMEKEQIRYLKNLWLRKDIGTLLIELIGMVVHQDYLGSRAGIGVNLVFDLLDRLAEILSIFLPSRTTSYSYKFLNHTYLAKNVIRPSGFPLNEVTKSITYAVGAIERVFSAFSVEVRRPFLDPDLGNFMILLPRNHKIRRGVSKHILRTAMKGLIPESIRKSTRKRGSSVPIVEWLIDLRPEINEMLSSKVFKERAMFNQKRILEAFKSLCEDKFDPTGAYMFASFLWRIINLELWLEIYIDPVRLD
jgi:asparagine synthase (glutamine-hydrolysing)